MIPYNTSEMIDNHSLESRLKEYEISLADLISFFRGKCTVCGHHRIMHDELGKCEGVMNKPCSSGCDHFIQE